MNALAADSGGFLIENTNDLGTGLRKILKDTETYYLIAYEPTNPRRDGAFRKIEVRLPGERDLKIRDPQGLFRPGRPQGEADGPGGTAPTAADAAHAAEERRESEMKRALTSPAPQGGIPVRAVRGFREPRRGRGRRWW